MSYFDTIRTAASTTRQLAVAWASYKTRRLQAAATPPDSWIAGGSDTDSDRWQRRQATREQLQEFHRIRQDGGIVASLLEFRALMVFGVGFDFQSPEDETEVVDGEELTAGEWLNEQLPDRDLLALDAGTDTYFYGYSLGEFIETRGGEFDHVELIEPWTTVPERNRKGEIETWVQEIDEHGETFRQPFEPDDIVHFKTLKASGRDRVGASLLGRGMDEAEAYRDNQEAIRNAVEMQGFPKYHVKLGREDGAVIDDNELRRARPMFENIDEMTKWVTGQDVDIETIEAEGFEFETITEHDLAKLTLVFMLPMEIAQISGGDGLGTGFPAKLRKQLFLLGAEAQQRRLGGQLVDQVGRRLLAEYSPFDPDVELEAVFDDPIVDLDELSTKIDAVGDAMTVNEKRSMFDLPPLEDEELGDQFGDPSEHAERGIGDNSGDDLPGGLFGEDDRALAEDGHWDEHFLALYQDVLWAEDGADRALFGPFSDGEVPQFVEDRIREAILAGDAVFSEFDTLADRDLMDLRMTLLDELTEDGWSISELRGELQDLEPGLEDHEAERIARTETQSIVNHAREQGYRERDDVDELRFRWIGPSDHRTTETCESIKERVPEDEIERAHV